jgi:hypothetical protein
VVILDFVSLKKHFFRTSRSTFLASLFILISKIQHLFSVSRTFVESLVTGHSVVPNKFKILKVYNMRTQTIDTFWPEKLI